MSTTISISFTYLILVIADLVFLALASDRRDRYVHNTSIVRTRSSIRWPPTFQWMSFLNCNNFCDKCWHFCSYFISKLAWLGWLACTPCILRELMTAIYINRNKRKKESTNDSYNWPSVLGCSCSIQWPNGNCLELNRQSNNNIESVRFVILDDTHTLTRHSTKHKIKKCT